MSEKIKIRWYREADYDAVEGLIQDLARLFNDSFNKNWFKLYMQNRRSRTVPGVFVAEKDGKVIGSIFVDVQRDPTGAQTGYISNMMVNKGARGQGIGQQLIENALNYLTIIGVPKVWANVRESTQALVHLFKKKGFKKKFSTFEYQTDPYGI